MLHKAFGGIFNARFLKIKKNVEQNKKTLKRGKNK